MSAYIRILPAVLIAPDILLMLGQKICLIVRDSLLLDPRMEDICSALEREGRTLDKLLSNYSSFSSDIDQVTIFCEKTCFIVKTVLQANLFSADPNRHSIALALNSEIENSEKNQYHIDYETSGERIKNIIAKLESDHNQNNLIKLGLQNFFDDLKEAYRQFEAVRIENEVNHKQPTVPSLRSAMSLYGMLIDTLIANVRFESYRLLHMAEPVINKIEAVVSEAMEITFNRNSTLNKHIEEHTLAT